MLCSQCVLRMRIDTAPGCMVVPQVRSVVSHVHCHTTSTRGCVASGGFRVDANLEDGNQSISQSLQMQISAAAIVLPS